MATLGRSDVIEAMVKEKTRARWIKVKNAGKFQYRCERCRNVFISKAKVCPGCNASMVI